MAANLYVMCWLMAIMIFLVSWKTLSSSHAGLARDSFLARRLWWRRKAVCRVVRPGCSMLRSSPALKQTPFSDLHSLLCSCTGRRFFSTFEAG